MFLSHFPLKTHTLPPHTHTHTIKDKKKTEEKSEKAASQAYKKYRLKKSKQTKNTTTFRNLKSHARSIYDRKL